MLSPSVKAQAIALLLQGKTTAEVAREAGVPHSVAKQWAEEVQKADFLGEYRDEMSRLLVLYMREALETLIAQQRIFRDPDWAGVQFASGLAELHGAVFDRTLRLFQALASPPPDSGNKAQDPPREVSAEQAETNGSES